MISLRKRFSARYFDPKEASQKEIFRTLMLATLDDYEKISPQELSVYKEKFVSIMDKYEIDDPLSFFLLNFGVFLNDDRNIYNFVYCSEKANELYEEVFVKHALNYKLNKNLLEKGTKTKPTKI